jgi:imidazolonepropionase-like amidohydrolase
VFDGRTPELLETLDVLVEGGRIKEVSDQPIRTGTARILPVNGRTLMPGLIDAHWFGTDLLGSLHGYQSREFLLRSEALSPCDILRSTTSVNAELLNQSGELGVVAAGAIADLIVVDGNPLGDLGLLQEEGRYLSVIMKGGELHKMDL